MSIQKKIDDIARSITSLRADEAFLRSLPAHLLPENATRNVETDTLAEKSGKQQVRQGH